MLANLLHSDFGLFAGEAFLALMLGGALLAVRQAVLGKDGPRTRLDLTGPLTLLALLLLFVRPQSGPASANLPGVLVPAALVYLIGLVFGYRPAPWVWRGIALFVVGLIAAQYHGVRIATLKVPFAESWVELGAVGTVLTALWLALFAGLFGRAATIPGVPAGVAALGGLTFYAICRLREDLTTPEGAFFALMLAGACLPQVFLAQHLRRGGATSGGYVIGFLVGVASIIGALKNTALLVAVVPLLIIGAPLFAAYCTYIADLRGSWRAVAHARRLRHLHEILLEQGYSPRQVLQIILGGTLFLCLLAIVLVLLITVSFVIKLLAILIAAVAGLTLFYVVLRMMPRPIQSAEGDQPLSVSLLGVKVHAVTMPQALAQAEKFIREDTPHMIVTSDASGVMRAVDDPEFRDIVNRADLVTPDGAGVILSARLLNIPLEARCSGCDMVVGLCGVAAELGRSVYLLGGAPGVAELAGKKLQEQFPDLRIAGCRDGYFKPEDEPEVLEEIKRTRPAVLFVALGIPRQEKWIREHLEELGVPVSVGIGGSLDVISGLKKRAPVWMQRAGIEWLYRVAKEPSRLPRLAALPRIVVLTFAELLRAPQPVDSADSIRQSQENSR